MEYGQGGDALVHSSRDARFALSARAERPHRLSMMEGINAGARSKACLFTGKVLSRRTHPADSSTALWLSELWPFPDREVRAGRSATGRTSL